MNFVEQHGPNKSVFDHISELRKKIFIALIAFVVGAIIAHIFHKEIIAFLLQPTDGQNLIFLSPLEPLFFIFKIDCITGIVISFPVIIWCILSYITPAFSKRNANLLIFFFIISILLLITSLLYAFLVTIPVSLKFLFSIVIYGIQNQISAQSYINFYIAQTLIIMIIFQVPILIIGGINLKAFKIETLAKKRGYIYTAITIALAIITPTVDIFSLLIVLIPCLIIFEISLIGGKIVEFLKRKKYKNN
jgi:sec-independent protein translocase protein TatC